MAFMQPEYTMADWYQVDCEHGETVYVMADEAPSSLLDGETSSDPRLLAALAPYCPIAPIMATAMRHRWGARLSAPGYLDCTDWMIADTEEGARRALAEQYDCCPDCGDDSDDEGCECEEEEGE